MGVLKVNVGDAVTPDWRNIGCGSGDVSGDVVDDFNRANSSTTVDPASDGGSWGLYDLRYATPNALIVLPVAGVASNRGYFVSTATHHGGCLRDSGQVAADVTMTFYTTSYYRGCINFATDPATGEGYTYIPWGGSSCLLRWNAFGTSNTTLGVSNGAPASGTVIRVTYDGVNEIKVYWNGVLKQTITDGSPLTGSGCTFVGWSAAQEFASTGETFDDFNAVGATIPGPAGRLKLWDGTRWMREVCDDDTGGGSTIADTATRADSTTTPNPASDGGLWTVDGGTWGISSNRLYMVSTAGGSTRLGLAVRCLSTDTGQADADVTVTNIRANTAAFSAIIFSTAAALSSPALYARFDSSSTLTVRYWDGSTDTQIGSSISMTAWGGGSAVLRITYNSSTGAVDVYQGGTLKGSRTAPTMLTGGVVAFGDQVESGSAPDVSGGTRPGEFWDDFSAVGSSVGGIERHPLKVNVGTPSVPDWQTVCCLTPA